MFVRSIFILDEDGDGPQPAKLVAGGRFDLADGVPAEGMARWDGQHWEAMGHFQDVWNVTSFLDTGVQKLMMADTDGAGPLPARLCAFGGVDYDVFSPVESVVAWNGTEWEPAFRRISDGLFVGILTAAVFDTDGPGPLAESVIIGGTWTNHISRWNGSAWETLGPGLDGNVRDLQVVPTLDGSGVRLVAAGEFSQRIVEWNGSGWTSIAPMPNQPVFAMLWTDGGRVLNAFGQFSVVGNTIANRAARFEDEAWAPIGSSDPGIGFHGAQPTVLRVLPDELGKSILYAGGSFTLLGTQTLRNVAQWDGRNWRELYGGALGGTLAFERFDADGPGPGNASLYAGGSFTVSAGGPGDRIAQWDGSSWHAIAASPNLTVNALQSFDFDGDGPAQPLLVAAGAFTSIGGSSFPGIAAWNGTAWQTLGTGVNSTASVLALHDPDGAGPLPALLVVGGGFVTAGAVTANGLATWNGTAWAALPNHGFTSVSALISYDPDGDGPALPLLFVAGLGADVRAVTRVWNGSTWTTVLPPGIAYLNVTGWTLHDVDGPGPNPAELFAVGWISEDNVEYRSALFHLTPDTLDVVAVVEDEVRGASRIASFDPDGEGPVLPYLCLSGSFVSISGQSAEHFAVLLPPDLGCDCPQPSQSCSRSDCAPLGGDCIVNLNDLGAVLSGYAPGVSGKSRATGDIYPAPLGDGVVDLQDLGAILSDYGSDCR